MNGEEFEFINKLKSWKLSYFLSNVLKDKIFRNGCLLLQVYQSDIQSFSSMNDTYFLKLNNMFMPLKKTKYYENLKSIYTNYFKNEDNLKEKFTKDQLNYFINMEFFNNNKN